jgi:lysozyme
MGIRQRLAVGLLAASAAGLGFITDYEHRSYTAYPDPVSGWRVPTICDGHTGPDVRRGMRATDAMCDSWRASDAATSAAAIQRCSPHAVLTQYEFDALVSLTHNIGPGAYCRSTIAKKVDRNDYEGAAAEFPRWVYAGNRVLPGLVKRRGCEAQLFRSGDYSCGGAQ